MRSRLLVLAAVMVSLLLSACSPAKTQQLFFICSNEESICQAWRDAYAASSGKNVGYLRLPTAQALTRIASSPKNLDFDVWVGGPAENFVLARRRGLLAPYQPRGLASIPADMHDSENYWFGVYGSLLGFCSNRQALAAKGLPIPTSWAELREKKYRKLVAASSPLTSGTAFTVVRVLDEIYGSQAKSAIREIYANVPRLTNSGTAPVQLVQAGEAGLAITFTPYCVGKTPSGQNLQISYPREGTSYEIGSAALLKNSQHPEEGKAFLDWLSQKPGQEVAVKSATPQLAITRDIPGSLASRLQQADPHILPARPQKSAVDRDRWLAWFASQGWD